MTDRTGRGPRNPAQWVSFTVAALVLAVVVGLVVVQALGADEPATPVARVVGRVRQEGGRFFVSVDVTNEGDLTAAEVQVGAELVVDGKTTDGDQTIDFLPGHETRHLTFAFDEDPATGELTVAVSGFTDPH